MNRIFTTLISIFIFYYSSAQELSKDKVYTIREEVRSESRKLVALLESNDTSSLQNYLLNWDNYLALKKELEAQGKGDIKQNAYTPAQYQKMNDMVLASLPRTRAKITKRYGDSQSINIKDIIVEMKMDSKRVPMYSIDIEFEKNYKPHLLKIEGLIKFQGKYYLLGGFEAILSNK